MFLFFTPIRLHDVQLLYTSKRLHKKRQRDVKLYAVVLFVIY